MGSSDPDVSGVLLKKEKERELPKVVPWIYIMEWCYWHATSFEEGLLAVVNTGGDADANAAIACAILGAKFGYDSIPRHYIENLYNEDIYRDKVNRFVTLALDKKR